MTNEPERRARVARTMARLGAAFASYGVSAHQATVAINDWAARMHAERMRHDLQKRMMRDWSRDQVIEFDRLVRRLHLADPELSLTDCMLRVGAAMEACRG